MTLQEFDFCGAESAADMIFRSSGFTGPLIFDYRRDCQSRSRYRFQPDKSDRFGTIDKREIAPNLITTSAK